MLYANFTDSSTNYGNHIIEHATQQFLENYFKENNNKVDFEHFDSFSDSIPTDTQSDLLIPGCTMLTPGQNKALDHLDKIKGNSYCLAGSLWYPKKSKDFIVRTRIISIGKDPSPDFSIVNKLSGIIGSRDRFTFEILKKNGLNTLYTGCPTLFLDTKNVHEGDYVLFSFGRVNFHKQVYYANKIAKNHKVIGIVHEKGRKEMVKAAGWKLPIVSYNGDMELYLSYFKNAKYVVTGRLHGVLPALAYGKKSFYFGTNDTRLSILDDLGIIINTYSDIPNFEKRSQLLENKQVLSYFKNNMTLVADSIFKK